MHSQLVLRGAFGEELVLTSWMNATWLQRACAVEPHRAGHVFQQQLFLNRDFFQRHRSNILSLPDMSSPLGSHRMSDAELQRMVLDHLTRSGRLILINVGLLPCGVGSELSIDLTGPPDAGPGWSGESKKWTQEKKLESMHPPLRPLVKAVVEGLAKRGFQPFIFYGWRSIAKQREIIKQKHSPVTFSFHNVQKKDGTPDAYAADIVDRRWLWTNEAAKHGYWKALGEEAKKQNLYWGGDWKKPRPDWAHVQLVPNEQLKRFRREAGL